MDDKIDGIKEKVCVLYRQHFGKSPEHVELLPASGSARKYNRLGDGREFCIGAYHKDVDENRLFIRFSCHFREKGLPVPQVYSVSHDGLVYLQEDLGNTMLLDVIEQERQAEGWEKRLPELYRKSLAELLRFQFLGGEGLDYSLCVPRPVFDRRCISWDLNYFKYCFLRLAGVPFSEDALENDFERLTARLLEVERTAFMFRDFQSRNIMVRENNVWFIDYQGGRQGALHYDVASLLYDAIAEVPEVYKESLLDDYIMMLQQYRRVDADLFRKEYYCFVLIRLLQAMGAFGLRGLYERKQHFIDSIQPGLSNISSLFKPGKLGNDYPEIQKVADELICTFSKTSLREG